MGGISIIDEYVKIVKKGYFPIEAIPKIFRDDVIKAMEESKNNE